MAEDGIRIVVINGSVRPGNYTAMASALVVDELKKHTEPKVQVDVVDPAEWHLPLPGTDPQSTATGALQKLVREATGVVLVTSEYHGGFSSRDEAGDREPRLPLSAFGQAGGAAGRGRGNHRRHQIAGATAQRVRAHRRHRAAAADLGAQRAESFRQGVYVARYRNHPLGGTMAGTRKVIDCRDHPAAATAPWQCPAAKKK